MTTLKQLTGPELQEARTMHRARMQEIAALCTPPGWTVIHRGNLSGRTYYLTRQLAAPKPVTRRALQIYLHECGHVWLEHDRRRRQITSHECEHEAEQWSMMVMRAFGVPVPRVSQERAREYVGRKILQAIKRGAKTIDKDAAEFALKRRGVVAIEGVTVKSRARRQRRRHRTGGTESLASLLRL